MERDPLEHFIADGRLAVRPIEHHQIPEVITVDLDAMATNINNRLSNMFANCTKLRLQYGVSYVHALNQINLDTTCMVDYLMGTVYNRLRSILEGKNANLRPILMNTRCPISNYLEFPRWVVSTLSCIGPCRVIDAADDKVVVFASSAATMANYGRANAVVFNDGAYSRLFTSLKAIGVEMSPFPSIPTTTPSYYPFLYSEIDEERWFIYGTVHSSHIENEDAIRIAFVSTATGVSPFAQTGLTAGYVDDVNTLNALAAVAAPDGIPAGQTAASAGRPVDLTFSVNYYGIQPAVAQVGATPARARGMYVLGRGMRRYHQFQLAHNLTSSEITEALRYRLCKSVFV